MVLCFGVLLMLSISCTKSLETKKELFKDSKQVQLEYQFLPDQPNVKQGLFKMYYPDGKLKVEATFEHGLPWTINQLKYPDGTAYKDSLLKNGNGIWIDLDDNGRIVQQCRYKNGLRDGITRIQSSISGTSLQAVYRSGVLTEILQDDAPFPDVAGSNDTSSESDGPKANLPSALDKSLFEQVMSLTQKQQYPQLHALTATEYKKTHSLADMQKYLGYIFQLYGPLKSYKLEGYELKNQAGVGEAVQVSYSCEFQYCKGRAMFIMLQEGGKYKMAGLGMDAVDYAPIQQIRKIGDPVLTQIQSQAYDQLYQATSLRFKNSATRDNFVNKLKELGRVSEFTLYQHQVGLIEGKLALVVLYEVKISSRQLLMELNFVQSESGFVLEGINVAGS
jgi:hypothetical protein